MQFSIFNSLFAAAPTLEAIYPPGAERGSTNIVTLSGKFDPWPPKIWSSAPGLDFTAQTNKGKFDLAVAGDAPPGPRLIRLYNDDGASEARFFVLGDGREVTDTETNNHFGRAQQIDALPVTINGRLDKSGDVDSFSIPLRAGQWLDARIDSHTLMSRVDAVLRLVTTNGHQLAWNHDFATFDPRLFWCASNDQTVVVQIYGFPYPATSDVKLYGSDSAIYRLRLTATNESPLERERPRSQHDPRHPHIPPFSCDGRITKADEEDRFRFTATPASVLQLKVSAAVLGSPLDAWLKVEDASGAELARNDDAEGTRDPSLEWKAPTNGAYTAVVGSLTHRGGPDYYYQLSAHPLLPDFRATLAANSLVVASDSTNSIKFNVKRLRGHTNELLATLTGLPEGTTSLSTNLSDKVSGEVTLQLIASTNAPTFSGPIQLKLTDDATKQERVVPFILTGRSEDNGVPGGYSTLLIDQLDHLWLTVKPKAAAEPAKETAKN